MPKPETSVFVVEDNPSYRNGLCDLINSTDGMSCVLACETCEEALEKMESGTDPRL